MKNYHYKTMKRKEQNCDKKNIVGTYVPFNNWDYQNVMYVTIKQYMKDYRPFQDRYWKPTEAKTTANLLYIITEPTYNDGRCLLGSDKANRLLNAK